MLLKRRLRIGDCVADLALNQVRRGDSTIALTPKAAGVLEVLVFLAGQSVSKERLLLEVWRDETPTDDVVIHAIGELRRAFGDDPKQPRYIRTLSRVGYALVAPVGEAEDDAIPSLPPRTHTEPETPSPVSAARPRSTPSQIRRWSVAAAGLALLAVIAFVIRGPERDESPPPRIAPSAATVETPPSAFAAPRAVTFQSGAESLPALSPDGSLLAYTTAETDASGAQLMLQVLGAGEPRRIGSARTDVLERKPRFSPDGRLLMFQRVADGQCRVIVVPVLGGAERDVMSCALRLAEHFEWTPDSAGLLYTRWIPGQPPRPSLTRRDLDSGELSEIAYEPHERLADVQPLYSPDGGQIAFRRGAVPFSDLFVMKADGSELRQLTRLQSYMPGFDWLPDGRELLFASDHGGEMALWRVDVASGALAGTGISNAAWPDVSRLTPRVAFARDNSQVDLVEVTIDGVLEEAPHVLERTSSAEMNPVFSPDGRQLVFLSDRGGEAGLWLSDAAGRGARLLVEEVDGNLSAPVWSADGQRIYVLAQSARGSRLRVVDLASGAARDLSRPEERVRSVAEIPEAGGLVYSSDRGQGWQLWRRAPGEREPVAWPRFANVKHLTGCGPGCVLYMQDADFNGLWRADPDRDAKPQLFSRYVGFTNQYAWQYRDGAVYLLASIKGTHGLYRRGLDELVELPPTPEAAATAGMATGELPEEPWTLVEPIPLEVLAESYFALSPDDSRLLYARMVRRDGDIWVSDLSATAP